MDLAKRASLETRKRVLEAMKADGLDWLLLGLQENIAYATGYRSAIGSMRGGIMSLAAVSSDGEVLVAAPAADTMILLEDVSLDLQAIIPYGEFYFMKNETPILEPSRMKENIGLAAQALFQQLPKGAVITADPQAQSLLAEKNLADAGSWMHQLRSQKTPCEIVLLERAAQITEDAIEAAIASVVMGVTEFELSMVINAHMAGEGMVPRFSTVTSGERSAFADVLPSDRRIQAQDILRFDVGGTLHGYWSDLGRTAVVGRPSAVTRQRYTAILEGENAQLEAAKPGARAEEIFQVAIGRVEEHGIRPYLRHHCGHGIGSEVYEPPIIAPGYADELQVGQTFCFETPFYEAGWGGVMVEDTIVITDDGCRLLNRSDRSLREI